jgi:hypothetical protein
MEVIDVGNLARPLLNDRSAQIYTNDVLLPYIQLAYGEAHKQLAVNGIGAVKEISAVIPVDVSMKAITIDEINDMQLPISLSERGAGETSYSPMYPRTWESTTEPGPILGSWTWRENEIKLIGASAPREVLVKYLKGFPTLINDNSPILINSSLEFLAYRAASLASRYIGGNIGRADALDIDAGRILPVMIATEIKNTQSMPRRRRPFRVFSNR